MPTHGSANFQGRSLRLEMLQVARFSRKALGESADLVRDFLHRQFSPGSGATDRAGRPDLYYTIFALAGLQALSPDSITIQQSDSIAPWLNSFGDGANLDFVHLGALARCLADGRVSPSLARALLDRLEAFRTPDGGYHERQGATVGHAYGCFVALGAYQDLGVPMPNPLGMVQCLKFLETPDGAWGNMRGMLQGTVPATAAAVALLQQLDLPINPDAGTWLLSQQHKSGGWLAVPHSPIPDLLSTATALHALACMQIPIPEASRELCLDYVDSLWNAEGGFHGHWTDDSLDSEYTFYGLLALGHLS